MTYTGKLSLMTCASLALCTAAHGLTPASSSANPYQGIVDRNVFALKPPPPPPPAVDNTKPTGPKIILTGITTILGKRALMKATLPKQNEPGKPPEPAKEESFMLKEGERQGEIEVLEINDKLGTVKVNNYGVVVTLDFEKDGPKTPSGPALTSPVGLPAVGGTPNTLPLGVPPKTGFNPSIPTRTLRLPNANNSGQPQNSGIPAPGAGAAYGSRQPALAAPEMHLTPEEQPIMTELERERTREQVAAGLAPPLPPTPLTSAEDLQAIMAPGQQIPGATGTPNSPTRNPQFPPRAPTLPPVPQF